MDKSFHIAELIYREMTDRITSEEIKELETWKQTSSYNLLLYEKARDPKKQLSKLDIYKLFNNQKAWNNIENELFEDKDRTIQLYSTKFLKYAAVIILPLLTGGSLLFYLLNNKDSQPNLANIDKVIQPGTQKAVLVLSDGATVELSENKTITEEADENTKIINENNALLYEEKSEKKTKLIFNELKTPRGGGYNLTLADGTQVWLNAGSSIKFPIAFSDSIRQVFLEGEGYFDVMPGTIPFVVTTDKIDVEVLGTSFNVSAYNDDAETKTTLVEGKVRVHITSENTTDLGDRNLVPNKQLIFNKEKIEMEVIDVNTDHYTSWMRGKLEFNNENLEQVMKKLARWYDFQYRFDNEQSKELHFTASFSKDANITSVIKILEMTTNVSFEFTENTLVIL